MEVAASRRRVVESSELLEGGYYVSKNHADNAKIRKSRSRDGETMRNPCTTIMPNKYSFDR